MKRLTILMRLTFLHMEYAQALIDDQFIAFVTEAKGPRVRLWKFSKITLTW